MKLIMSVNVNPHMYSNIAAMLKNGPNGIILSFFEIRRNSAIGKAINVAKKILHIDIAYPITNPIRNINFMSPPPSESCLNI